MKANVLIILICIFIGIFSVSCIKKDLLNIETSSSKEIKESNDSVNKAVKEDGLITIESVIEKLKIRFVPFIIIVSITVILVLLISIVFRKIKNFFKKKWEKNTKKQPETQQHNIMSVINFIGTVLKFVVIIIGILISFNLLEIIEFKPFKLRNIFDWLLTSGINILITIITMIVLLKFVKIILERIKISLLSKYEKDQTIKSIDKAKKSETLSKLTGYVLKLIIWASGIISILSQFSIELAPIIASAGILGVAVGFGSQNLIKDVIQGIFILIENQFHVGDVISVAGVSGIVEDFNIRYTRIRNLSGSVFFIPNGEIKVVENMTKEWSKALLDIEVAYKEDIDNVILNIEEVANETMKDEKFKDIILEPIEILGVEKLGSSGVTIRAVIKTLPLQQWAIARELRRRIKAVFDKKNIEIPFPQLTISIGDGKNQKNLNVLLKHYEQKEISKRIEEIKSE